MKYDDQLAAIAALPFDSEQSIYRDGELKLYVFRPSELAKRFEGYDVKKNFQIWLRRGDRKFKPNHLRVMIDSDLRVRGRPDLQSELAEAFDSIFYGTEPLQAIAKIKNETFGHFLNSLEITAYLSQLFIIEQDYAYRTESKYNPRTLFYQGWIRQIIDSGKKEKEIDNLIMSIANRQPPAARYTSLNDKNHRNHQADPESLWWLDRSN